jgi:probable HAF family extracellular repeat protein
MQAKKRSVVSQWVLFSAVAVPLGLAAQAAVGQNAAPQRHHYKLIDLGTLGGPLSSTSDPPARGVNNRGAVVGGADTSTPNPNASNPCLFCNPDPFLSHAFQWQRGHLTDLGALPGANSSFASSVTDSGVSVGWSSDNEHIDPLLGIPQMRATMWRSGAIVDLGTLEGGYESVAAAANNRGQVVGVSANLVPDPFGPLGTQNRMFLWQNGAMEDLNTLGGNDAGFLDLIGVVAINERGQVAACSYANAIANPITGTPTLDPFLWQHGSMRDLGTLGGTSGCATALNNRGQVVGYSNLKGDLTFHAFVWDREELKDLGTLGGDRSVALAINEAGQIIGRAGVTEICTACSPGNQKQLHHPFLWKDGAMTDLGLVAGDTGGTAYSINSRGQIVGISKQCMQINSDDSCDGPVSHGFLWEDGSLFDLQSLIDPASTITVTSVTNINERGEITGTGVLANGDTHAYLLVPCGAGDGCL